MQILPINDESLALAQGIINTGGVIVMPTDTVYGIACDPCNSEAIDRIFTAKHRPRAKTVQVLLSQRRQIEQLDLRIPEVLVPLVDSFMPGAFSPICEVGSRCHLRTTRMVSTLDGVTFSTQAVRIPQDDNALRILHALGPLAASSANQSGNVSAHSVAEAVAELGDSVDLYLDGGVTPGPIPSTVVAADYTHVDPDDIVLLREGCISQDKIRATLHHAFQKAEVFA